MNKEHKEFLDELRESGVTNMIGATPYIMEEFSLEKREARSILLEWIKTFKNND